MMKKTTEIEINYYINRAIKNLMILANNMSRDKNRIGNMKKVIDMISELASMIQTDK